MEREKLGSRLGFILISAGCAIGVGNVWKFPTLTGQNGGAVFVLIRLVVELISYLIQKKVRRIKENISTRMANRREMAGIDPADLPYEGERPKRVKRRRRKDSTIPKFIDELEEKIVPIDECLLSDIEEI